LEEVIAKAKLQKCPTCVLGLNIEALKRVGFTSEEAIKHRAAVLSYKKVDTVSMAAGQLSVAGLLRNRRNGTRQSAGICKASGPKTLQKKACSLQPSTDWIWPDIYDLSYLLQIIRAAFMSHFDDIRVLLEIKIL